MASFPFLKTSAVMQYPARKTVQYSSQVLQFVDGSEQSYRDFAAPRLAWVIRLDLLDEDELARLEDFFVSAQGRFGSFSFTDPWDGVEHTDCSLLDDEAEFRLEGALRAGTVLVVRENRS